jgi:hypothetical protein
VGKKKSDKKRGKYVAYLKLPLLIIFLLSVIQCILFLLGISGSITIVGILEFIIAACTGFYLVSKKKFRLRNNLFAGTLLFASSLLIIFFIPSLLPKDMPFIFRLISYSLILLLNLILFMLASVIGGIVARMHLTLKKRRNKKHK